jgi:hypothetical protein
MKMRRATQNFAYGTEVGERWVYGGAELDENDPVVKAFPDLFEPVEPQPDPQPASPPRRRRNG